MNILFLFVLDRVDAGRAGGTGIGPAFASLGWPKVVLAYPVLTEVVLAQVVLAHRHRSGVCVSRSGYRTCRDAIDHTCGHVSRLMRDWVACAVALSVCPQVRACSLRYAEGESSGRNVGAATEIGGSGVRWWWRWHEMAAE